MNKKWKQVIFFSAIALGGFAGGFLPGNFLTATAHADQNNSVITSNLTDQLKAAQAKVDAAQATYNQALTDFQKTQTDLMTNTTSLKSAQKALDQANQALNSAKSDLSAAQKNASPEDAQKIKDLGDQLTAQQQLIMKTTTDLSTAQAQAKTLASQLVDGQSTIDSINQQITSLKSKVSQGADDVNKLNKELSDLDHINQDVTSATTKVTDDQSAVDSATAKLTDAKLKVTTAQTTLDEAKKTASSQISTAQTQLDNAKKAQTDAQTVVDQTKASIAALEADNISIKLPTGYNEALFQQLADVIHNQNATQQMYDDASKAINPIANLGVDLNANGYTPTATDKAQQVNMTSLSAADQLALTQFTAELINSARVQFGYPALKVTQSSLDFAKAVIEQYEQYSDANGKKTWDISAKGGHYNEGIEKAASQYGLNDAGNYYEDAGTAGYILNQGKTMADLKQGIFTAVIDMLFNDGNGEDYLHATSLLGINAGKVTEFLGVGTDNLDQIHLELVPDDTRAYIKDPTKFDTTNTLPVPDGTGNDQKVKDLQAKLTDQQKSLSDATQAVTDAQTNLDTVTKAGDISKLADQLTAAQGAQKDAQDAADKANSQLTADTDSLNKLKAQQTDSQQQKVAKQQALDDAQKTLTATQTDLAAEQTKLATATSNQAGLQKSQSTVNQTLNDLNQKLTTANTAVSTLTKQLNNIKDADSTLTKAQTTLDAAQVKLDAATKQYTNASQNTQAAQKANDVAQAKRDQAKEELDATLVAFKKIQSENGSNSGTPTNNLIGNQTVVSSAPSTNNETGVSINQDSNGKTTNPSVNVNVARTKKVAPFKVYAKQALYRYTSPSFKKGHRVQHYSKRTRRNAPTFTVVGTARSTTGQLRYKLSDGSYITANPKFVAALYWKTTKKHVYVYAVNGIYEYKGTNLSNNNRVRKHSHNAVLRVKHLVRHGSTTRLQLTNGHFISGSKKLVSMHRG